MYLLHKIIPLNMTGKAFSDFEIGAPFRATGLIIIRNKKTQQI